MGAIQDGLLAVDGTISMPDFDLGMPDLNIEMPTIPNIDIYSEHFAEWSAEMARQQKDYLADVAGHLPDVGGALDPITGLEILPGYDPPPLNIGIATAEMAQAAKDFLAKQADAIDNIVGGAANMMGVGDNSSGSWIFNWSMPDMSDSSNFDWKVEGFHALEMDIMGLKISVDNIFTMAVWADVAWRVYISTRLVIKYWFRSSEAIPALDMRRSTLQQGVMVTGTASMLELLCSFVARFSPVRLCMSYILSPYSAAAFGGLGVLSATELRIPMAATFPTVRRPSASDLLTSGTPVHVDSYKIGSFVLGTLKRNILMVSMVSLVCCVWARSTPN